MSANKHNLQEVSTLLLTFCFISLNRKLSLNYLQHESSGNNFYKDEGSKRRKSRRRNSDMPSMSKNDANNIRRSQVCSRA